MDCRRISQADAACNLSVNYAATPGDRILPFEMRLNTALSNLNPQEGELQRFVYDITASSPGGSAYADLSHFVLGICPDITQGELANVSVTIDGVPQTVILGENVEIATPDPPTGCSGLKFDFGLDKVDGRMRVSFDLAFPRPIGPGNVCMFGGGVTVSGQSICAPACAGETSCVSVGHRMLDICLPVTVTPYANAGEPALWCCGAPVVEPGTLTCPGAQASCSFTLTQRVCVTVPVEFGAEAEIGTPGAICETDASQAGCDCG